MRFRIGSAEAPLECDMAPGMRALKACSRKPGTVFAQVIATHGLREHGTRREHRIVHAPRMRRAVPGSGTAVVALAVTEYVAVMPPCRRTESIQGRLPEIRVMKL